MIRNLYFRKTFVSALLLIHLLGSQTAFSEKTVMVTRESLPWMKTVLTDALYGSLIGGLGYGAVSLIGKNFQGEALGASLGVGFIVGALVGVFDAAITDSTALINYDNGTRQFALAVPQTQILVNQSTHGYGAQMQLIQATF